MYNKIIKKINIISNKMNLYNSIKVAINDKQIIAYWSNNTNTKNNWGDAINPFIIEKISRKNVSHINSLYNIRNKPVYSVVGSILHHKSLKYIKNLVIWGSGLISDEKEILFKQNAEIHAVRGPLTREILLQHGYRCPDVYGDPALLFPIIYPKKKRKRYKLGIIPHYKDKDDEFINKIKRDNEILVIDINSKILKFVDQVLSCELIASSSLHGLILADAYNIPSIWIKMSDKIIGADFKFQDYFLSVGRKNEKPLIIDNTTNKYDIINNKRIYEVKFNREILIKSCPFKI